jgi:hypothetical protein
VFVLRWTEEASAKYARLKAKAETAPSVMMKVVEREESRKAVQEAQA